MKTVKTRFAPSPTGVLHIGGLRTAIWNYLYAKKNKGKFIIRIEDTDQNRLVDNSKQYIINSLKSLNIESDEEIINQSDRLQLYKDNALELISKGFAYTHTDNTIRLNLSSILNETIVHNDLLLGEVSFKVSDLKQDVVLIKSDGYPTYHLASVVDDHYQEITHIIRGNEWLSSVPIHIILYKFFNWEIPNYAHVPLILKSEGKGKLSKRELQDYNYPVILLEYDKMLNYKEEGISTNSVFSYLCQLGCKLEKKFEYLDYNSLIKWFDIDKISKSNVRYDYNDLLYVNRKYYQQLGIANFITEYYRYNNKIQTFNSKDNPDLFEYYKSRFNTMKEISERIQLIYSYETLNHLTESQKEINSLIHKFITRISKVDIVEYDFTKYIKTTDKDLAQKVIKTMRLRLTGYESGCDIKLLYDSMTEKDFYRKLKQLTFLNENI